MSDSLNTDVLVVGSGAAGLCAALEARASGARVLLLSSSPIGLGNSTAITTGTFKGAVGGASPAMHRNETLEAGRGLCDADLVERLIQDAPERIVALKNLGVPLHTFHGGADLEGHHREAAPGRKITAVLAAEARKAGVQVLERTRVAELIARDDRIAGALAFLPRSTAPRVVHARAVVLATGGYAGLFPRSTNPRQNTGSGHILALRAGATLQDLEFVQFVPLGVVESDMPAVLVPAEVLDHIPVVNRLGERFLLEQLQRWGIERPSQMDRYVRDKATRAVWTEIAEGRGDDSAVLMALDEVDEAAWKLPELRHFHKHALRGRKAGRVRVAPLPHFSIGGITVTPSCETGVVGLYAAGEATGGLHGANRLGGNALTETVVFGSIAGGEAACFSREVAREDTSAVDLQHVVERDAFGTHAAGWPLHEIRNRLQEVVGRSLGPVRSESGLSALLETVLELKEHVGNAAIQSPRDHRAIIELREMVHLSELIARSALVRAESRGSHVRLDYPAQSTRLGSSRVYAMWKDQVFVQEVSNLTNENT